MKLSRQGVQANLNPILFSLWCCRYPKNFGDKEAIQTGGEWYARRNRSGYLEDISACLNALHSGESYELCLTTKLQHANRVDPFKLYMELRTRNPSMHGAWLNFGKDVPKVRKISSLHPCFLSREPYILASSQ